VSDGAGSRILAVNSIVEIGNQAGGGQAEAASRNYLATLDRQIGRIPYQRVVQLNDEDLARLPNGSIGGLITANYREHYQHIANAGENSRGQKLATVDAVRAKYPVSFVILHDANDDHFGGRLIWQMHEHVYDSKEQTGSVQLTGVFIIRDPDGIIVPTFMEWFDELTQSKDRWPLRSQNLMMESAPVATANTDGQTRRSSARMRRKNGGGNDTRRPYS
jgi:hypothetical protein